MSGYCRDSWRIGSRERSAASSRRAASVTASSSSTLIGSHGMPGPPAVRARPRASPETAIVPPCVPGRAVTRAPERPPHALQWNVAAGYSSALAAEVGVEVAGQGFGVGVCAVNVGGGAGAEYRQAEKVEAGRAGDHAA